MNVYDKPGNQAGSALPGPGHRSSDDGEENQPYDAKDIDQKENQSAGDEASQKGDHPHPEGDAVENFFRSPANDKHNDLKGGLKGKLVKYGSKKVLVGGIGAGIISIFFVVASFLGFLNVFKLDHIMKNVEFRAFTRYQVAMDKRSDKWIRSYLILRLSEIDGTVGSDGLNDRRLFRADSVDTNHPLTDWYRTLRTSKFEDDLLKKHGIAFTSIEYTDAQGARHFRAAQLKLPDGLREFQVKDINKLGDELGQFIDQEFDSDKEGRRAIKTAVNKETRSWQVIKRRHIRKNIQNINGVRDWRFFEKTRTKIEEKKIFIRNKIIMKALPDSTKSGKIIQCLFGIITCRSSRDVIDIENRTISPTVTGDADKSGKAETTTDADGKPITTEVTPDDEARIGLDKAAKEAGEELTILGVKATIIKQILAKFNFVTGVASMVDTLARINKMFESGSLIKMVVVARGMQAMGLFTTYMIASDQLKTGEVTGEEVGEFMQTIDAVSNSEGWTSVISNSNESASAEGEPFVVAKDREEYCSEKHQAAIENPVNHEAAEDEFAYLCEDKKIGGINNAEKLTSWWEKSFGVVLSPILELYEATPLGEIFSGISWLVGAITEPIINALLKATGLDGKIEDLMSWIVARVASILGAGPMMNGTEPSGVFANMIIQGGAYSAESSSRSQGASLTTSQTAQLARQDTIAYLNEQSNSQSTFDKYLSFENPNSTLSQGLFASIQNTTVNNFAGIFSQFIKNAAKAPLNIFSKPANAATDSPYSAANFAGIETYDFPQECYDLDPLTMTPAQVTNANAVLAEAGVDQSKWFTETELTWDLVNNNTAFYDLLYQKLRNNGHEDDADDFAVKVYNCAAMDTTIRGGLGAVYGYDKDNGLTGSGDTSTTTTPTPIVGGDTSNIACKAGTDSRVVDGYKENVLIKIRVCNVQGIVVNSQISGDIDALINAARAAGYSLSGGGFRTMAKQTELWNNRTGNVPVAKPGYSNHQMGFAIDFTSNPGTGSALCFPNNAQWCRTHTSHPDYGAFAWLDTKAGKYRLKSLSSEAWHWSVMLDEEQ